jgi:hypothetical protein
MRPQIHRFTFLCALTACLLFAAAEPASACAVCFTGEGNPLTDAVNGMIFAMLAPLIAVLGAFIAFIIYLVKKSRTPLPDHELLGRSLE